MDRMSGVSKKIPKPASASEFNVPDDFSKWLGLISAGAAIGLGLFALKEIKNTRKELLSIKTNGNEKIEKKMETIEQQMKEINNYIKNTSVVPKPIQRPVPNIVKIKKEKLTQIPIEQENIVIINEEYNPDEYEEVEVTDSESED